MRLKAIQNIGKITKSMKMIASTKLVRAQKAMDVGRAFGEVTQRTNEYIKYNLSRNMENQHPRW